MSVQNTRPASATQPATLPTVASAADSTGCGDLVLEVARLYARHYDLHLSSAGMRFTQFTLLTHIVRSGPLMLSELAKRIGATPSTMTRNIQVMQQNGWVTVVEQGRRRRVTLTPSGRQAFKRAERLWAEGSTAIRILLGGEVHAALVAALREARCKLSQ